MATIVTRAGKGSALTWTEGDSNFTNLNTAKLENVVEDTTPQLGGPLDVNGNSIVSTSNADITIAPNGTGNVNLDADTVRIGDAGTGNVTLTNNNTGFFSIVHATQQQGLSLGNDGSIGITPANGMGFYLGDNIGLNPVNILSGSSGIFLGTDAANPSSITISGAANGHIVIAPDGTGDVRLDADTVRVGDSGAAATIISNGAGALTVTTGGAANLVLSTANGSSSGTITITAGANGNITFAPNGTGSTVAQGTFVAVSTPASAGTSPSITRTVVTASNTVRYYSGNLQKQRSDILLAAMTNEPVTLGWSVRDSGSNNRIFASQRAVYQGTGTNPYFTLDVSVDGFTTTVPVVTMGGGTATWGSSGTYTHTTSGTTDLILSTNSGTNSGTITINDGANANIAITPNGTGDTVITNLAYNEAVFTGGSTTGTITPNAGNAPIQSITLTGSITFNAFTTPISGQTLTLIITQPASGGPYTLTSTMLFAGGSKTLSTAANAVDILTVSYIGTTYYASLAKAFA